MAKVTYDANGKVVEVTVTREEYEAWKASQSRDSRDDRFDAEKVFARQAEYGPLRSPDVIFKSHESRAPNYEPMTYDEVDQAFWTTLGLEYGIVHPSVQVINNGGSGWIWALGVIVVLVIAISLIYGAG